IGVHTVREPSSLAMSSRNGYLTSEQRNQASQLNNTLQDIVNLVNSGANDYPKLEQQAKTTLIQQGWLVDYISIRSSLTLAPAKDTDSQLVVLGAAKLANTRLIDNIEFLR
ncbi:MAG: pantoate--beta-alanine ligase, partial [Methylotenera sp.]